MMEDMELDMALSDEQAEYFKDTDIIDDNHNPKLCYHGTKSELHNEIDEARFGSQAGSGFVLSFTVQTVKILRGIMLVARIIRSWRYI